MRGGSRRPGRARGARAAGAWRSLSYAGENLLGELLRRELVQGLARGEREEHALERAHEQLEAADDHPRVAEREHQRVQLGALGREHETTPGRTVGPDTRLLGGDLERACVVIRGQRVGRGRGLRLELTSRPIPYDTSVSEHRVRRAHLLQLSDLVAR